MTQTREGWLFDSLPRGLTVDLFAGGGGASSGIEWATGRSPDTHGRQQCPTALGRGACTLQRPSRHPQSKEVSMKTQRHITAADDVERIYGKTKIHLTVESFAAASGLSVEFIRANGITKYNNGGPYPLHELRPDPHAKRRLADGRNAWKKLGLTPGAREEFADWLLENGLGETLLSNHISLQSSQRAEASE